MASDRVWPAMLDAFQAGSGSASLTTRLLDALDAAEREGGDLRGRQSAAILVVPAQGEPWRTLVSLRVEDHPEPLPELRRVVRLHEAYGLAGHADELLNAGRHDEAARLYVKASECAPDNHELLFWAGLGSVQAGDLEAGVAKVRCAIELQPTWQELLPRLPAELAPAAPAVLARLAAGS
jgi:tetratricopeptide (TPR) repeat protein